jgi:anti-anti-sigma factor
MGTAGVTNSTMTTLVRPEGNRTVIVLAGEADFFTVPVLSDVVGQVMATTCGDVVIDFGEVDFIDSATVRALAVNHFQLVGAGRRLVFRSPPRLAVLVLDVLGLSDLIATEAAGE